MPEIIIASKENAAEILELQKEAFLKVAELENNFNIQPLTQTLEELEKEFEQCCILKYIEKDQILGSVRGYVENGTCHISKLMVHPSIQNKGIGRTLLKRMEETFPGMRYELFTGSESKKNIQFYEKMGYSVFKMEQLPRETTIFAFMEKA